MSADSETKEVEGSWIPFILLSVLFILGWLVYGKSSGAVGIRRWYNMRRISIRKQLGYRDESKYQMGAGEGANQKYQRQG
mmetsp:Transcript_31576/g.52130  ORF Transcript_31576/g.52130 Transcript_31576/m.52130 type:complete len:80 (+) Transcript_31576:114-353(+)